MTVLYPNPCYNKVCYKGPELVCTLVVYNLSPGWETSCPLPPAGSYDQYSSQTVSAALSVSSTCLSQTAS